MLRRMLWAWLDSLVLSDGLEEIANDAFGWAKITSVHIPSSIKKIGNTAFKNNELKELHIRHEKPEEIDVAKYAFEDTAENCTLYVPIGTGYAYRHHPVFGNFKEIVVEKPTPNVQAVEKDIIKSESTPVFNGYAEARYSQDRTILQQVYEGFNGEFYVPNGVVKINPRAFQDCEGITAVLINSYTAGLSPAVMGYIINSVITPRFGGSASCDEIGLRVSENGLALPCGSTAVWLK